MKKANTVILIVEDNKIERNNMGVLLSNQKYELAFASDGNEAIRKSKELMPDIILLDVMLPDIDGYEVCRRIRSDEILSEVPIIMITGLNDRESRLQGIISGADDFITKPFDREELRARIQTIARLNRYRHLLTINSELQKEISNLSILCDILGVFNATLDVNSALKSIPQKIKDLVNAKEVSIYLKDGQRNKSHFLAFASKEKDETEIIQYDVPIDLETVEKVLSNKEISLIQDYKIADKTNGISAENILYMPLLSRRYDPFGVLEVVIEKPKKFTQRDMELLETISNNIASSIERSNLYNDLRKAESILRYQNAELRQAIKHKYSFDNIIGSNIKLINVIKTAEQVALTDSTVLIYGETGTGKELLARAIHDSSTRATGNFIPVNCGAIPKDLLESELFGHEKGSFTGASARRIGRFEAAEGGTIFLDEIGDMSPDLQVKLLRVLQENVIQRLGSNEEIQVNVRVIAATNQDLNQLVSKGGFRQDLYYRLKVFELRLPSLRERKDDIPVLVNHFITHFNEKLNKQIIGIEDDALKALCNYDYPGNIRELQNIIQRAMILCKSDTITIDVLPEDVIGVKTDGLVVVGNESIPIPQNNDELKLAKADIQNKLEKVFLTELLSRYKGNISLASRMAKINRSWLTEMIGKHNLEVKDFK
ncbi:TPA: response regulator [Candidatus Poribacteria bacterium]|nr:response regulator [Candidatus Poribacteria bacterium]